MLTPDQQAALDLAVEGHRFQKRSREKIPDIAFLYYRDRANIEEIMRRCECSRALVDKVIDNLVARKYIDLIYQDTRPLEHRTGQRSTRGRWIQ